LDTEQFLPWQVTTARLGAGLHHPLFFLSHSFAETVHHIQISPALTVLTKLIYSLDDEILIDACWAISYLSDGSNDKIQAVIESGVCRRLVDLLMHNSTSVQTPALRSVGNIVTGDDLQTQVVIASGALPALLSLLSSPKDGIRKEACWTISNITAGSPPQIQSVIDANIIPPLIHILQHADFKTRKEACWAISNATSGGLQEPSQIRYLVSQGCIKPLCDLLTMMDNKIIQVALDGLDNILKVGEMDKQAAGPGAVNQYALYVEEAGGMITIHNLQQHDNLEIYKKAFNIMDKYFPDDDEVDAGAPANVDASGAFAVGSLRCLMYRGIPTDVTFTVHFRRQCSPRWLQLWRSINTGICTVSFSPFLPCASRILNVIPLFVLAINCLIVPFLYDRKIKFFIFKFCEYFFFNF
jgi:hypothetical protein